jgi:hypothetical protein
MTDEDAAAISALEKKYQANLTLADGDIYRRIYLLETLGALPPPISTGLMLDKDEITYHSISTTWSESRMHNRGYSGMSVSVPTGIRGVRFRFGGYTPNRVEEVTPLSSGTLFITSRRLLFNGEKRSTTVAL